LEGFDVVAAVNVHVDRIVLGRHGRFALSQFGAFAF
jgi:hypothetical protein